VNQTTELVSFLDRLKQRQTSQVNDSRRDFEACLRHLCDELPRLQQRQQVYETKASPKFNVFRILRVETKEVRLHSAVIAELLDPLGAHGQGFLFLKSFFSILQANLSSPVASLDEKDQWFVEKEKFIGTDGRIDLLLSCLGQGYILAIENKIWAGEQPEQMDRYWHWLQERRKKFQHKQLIFLTPTGRKPVTAKEASYICLSYDTNIRNWLEGTLEQIQSSTVQGIIKQYLQIIPHC
jgi:hypothetical protein